MFQSKHSKETVLLVVGTLVLLIAIITPLLSFRLAFLAVILLLGYCIYSAIHNPLELVWDLDQTLLLSLNPLSKGHEVTSQLSLHQTVYFDQIDDDFEFEDETPNTRTFWRPHAKRSLQMLRLFSYQHVFTAAQGSYTENIMNRLDPNEEIFTSITHRGHPEYKGKLRAGKDLLLVVPEEKLHRTILFDDRAYNFDPQPQNGVHVNAYKRVATTDSEMFRLVSIIFICFLTPGDIRPVLSFFRSVEHDKRIKAE